MTKHRWLFAIFMLPNRNWLKIIRLYNLIILKFVLTAFDDGNQFNNSIWHLCDMETAEFFLHNICLGFIRETHLFVVRRITNVKIVLRGVIRKYRNWRIKSFGTSEPNGSHKKNKVERTVFLANFSCVAFRMPSFIHAICWIWERLIFQYFWLQSLFTIYIQCRNDYWHSLTCRLGL